MLHLSSASCAARSIPVRSEQRLPVFLAAASQDTSHDVAGVLRGPYVPASQGVATVRTSLPDLMIDYCRIVGAGERGRMPKYLVQVGYTPEAWAAMAREPQSVVERVRPSAEALGGSIESLFYCFGDYDLVGVVDFPDNRGAAAWSMAVSSGGDVRAFKTTTLLTLEEGQHALGRASEAARTQRPPTAPF